MKAFLGKLQEGREMRLEIHPGDGWGIAEEDDVCYDFVGGQRSEGNGNVAHCEARL